jgi:hypothetical protein
MEGKLGRAALAVAAIIDTARARSNRRAAAAQRRPRPTSGALAPPVPETFESTTTSYDGTQTRVSATTSPGNQVAGERLPGGQAYDPHLEPQGSLSIAEDSGHPANQKSRPVTWIVVTLIALAFAVVGLGLVYLWPWLFVAGLVAVVATSIAGWGAGIMADRGDPNQTREALSTKRM